MPDHGRGESDSSLCQPRQTWRDSNNEERLNGENGLLLKQSIDHLFDRGILTRGSLPCVQHLLKHCGASWIRNPTGIAVDGDGNIYFTDTNNFRVRKIDTNGYISTVAGNGVADSTGEGGPATAAALLNPNRIALDAAGNIYFSQLDYNFPEGGLIRKVDTAGNITTVAGTMRADAPCVDGGNALACPLNFPGGIVLDPAGNIYNDAARK